MKKRFVLILQFSMVLSVFSQQKNGVYHKGLTAFTKYNYIEALHNFNLASDYFLKNDDIVNHLKSKLYISNILIYKNNFSLALKTTNTSLKKYTSSGIKNDSLRGELMNIKALIYRLDGNGKEALKISDIILAEQLRNPSIKKYNLVKTYTIRSRILILLTRYDETIRLIENTLDFPEINIPILVKAELLNNLGNAYLLKDNFNKAYYYYSKAYQIKLKNPTNLYDLAITAFNIGIIHEAQGDYKKAIEFYKKSAEYDLQNQGEEVGFISDIYVALSNVYTLKNDLEKAEEYIEKALHMSISIFGKDNLNVANVYTSYARLLKLKEKHKESLEFDKKALVIREKSNGIYNQFPIENLMSMAKTYAVIGLYIESKKKYIEALRRIKKLNSKVLEANCYLGLGSLHLQIGANKKSVDYFNNAYIILLEFFYKNHKFTLEAELLLAKALFNNKEYDKALSITDKHLSLESKNEHNFPSLLVEAVHITNLVALSKYEESNKISDLKKSYNNLDIIIQNIKNIKKEYTSEVSRINSNKRNIDYFEKSIEACHILYENTNEKQYLEKAFQISEINRNSSLLAGIRDEKFKKMAGVPDSLLQNENTLKQLLGGVKEAIYNEEQSSVVDSLMSQRLDYSSRLDELLHKIEKEFPKYYQLKYADFTVPISYLQKKYLGNNDTFIEYYTGNENIYAFIINKEHIDFVKLSNPSIIKNLVSIYRKQLIKQQSVEETSKKLFDFLLKGFDIRKRLILVTDDVLSYLPFEALLDNDQYLFRKHTISYVGSATLLQTHNERFSKKRKESTWIGFAPEYEGWNSLSSNSAEIDGIAKLMKGSTFLGSEASLKNFVKQASNSSVLHLATHATLDSENPLYNKLIFSKNSEDFELTASEIYTLPIESELVVLSACNTGFGKLEKSEGIMSMSRAFHYAGAKSTVMSLWKVPDKETAAIMFSFYNNLNKGLTKDHALQNAKLEYLDSTDDPLLKHPYYWAGFVVSGNTDPLSQEISNWWIVILISIPLLLFRKKLIKLFK